MEFRKRLGVARPVRLDDFVRDSIQERVEESSQDDRIVDKAERSEQRFRNKVERADDIQDRRDQFAAQGSGHTLVPDHSAIERDQVGPDEGEVQKPPPKLPSYSLDAVRKAPA